MVRGQAVLVAHDGVQRAGQALLEEPRKQSCREVRLFERQGLATGRTYAHDLEDLTVTGQLERVSHIRSSRHDSSTHDTRPSPDIYSSHLLGETAKPGEVDLDAGLADEVATRPAAAPLEPAEGLQRAEGLPQCHPADSEGRGELLLRWQLVVGVDLAGVHPAQQPGSDP